MPQKNHYQEKLMIHYYFNSASFAPLYLLKNLRKSIRLYYQTFCINLKFIAIVLREFLPHFLSTEDELYQQSITAKASLILFGLKHLSCFRLFFHRAKYAKKPFCLAVTS